MVENSDLLIQNKMHAIWQDLAAELADMFDPHGIYAAVAQKIAQHAGVTAVVGATGAQGRYFDVWICQADGEFRQTRWTRDKASFFPLIETGKATYHDKLKLPASQLITSELWQLPKQGILAVPLPLPGIHDPVTPDGVLCLIDPEADNPLTLTNLPTLANNITMVLDRAYLRNHVHRQDIEFAVVSEISYALASTLSLQNIYEQLMDPVRRSLDVETISVGLIEENTGDIVFVQVLMGPLFATMSPIRLRAGQGIAGWVADNRKPLIINDVYHDKRFYSKVDLESGFQTNSMVCLPLQIEDRVIGVIQAINKKVGHFSEGDLVLLQAITGPLAAAIENARLHASVIAEKRRIETIFANMSEGLVTINADGFITNANDSFLTAIGAEAGTLIGKEANKVIRFKSSSLAEFSQVVHDAESEGDYPQLATDLMRTDGGAVPVLVSGASVRSDDGEVTEMIFVVSDLRQIREVERMRDDFFHGIIHELRTPLATILMYARLLKEGKAREREKADRFLGVIERESDRLQKMVRQMLELAKMEAREFQRSPEPVRLNPILEEMLPPLADRAIAKSLTFRQKISQDLPSVMGNQETLYLIFKNLVDNAI
ncbi:MAG: histidine kinase dimerization/phospho-acceptor domain-containing protein, partial [Anaerolineae bacterium]